MFRSRVCSAWRIEGGCFYKVELRRRIKWDWQHACSCKACNHLFELFIIIFCFACTLFVFSLLSTKELRREREQAGPGTTAMMGLLLAGTCAAVLVTIRTLLRRWSQVSTDVFVSEV